MSSNIYNSSTKTLVPIAGNASNSLNMLDDVALSSPTNGQVLKYDATNQVWVNGTGGGGGGGTSDYTDLTNKPSIEGVTLSGNKSADDLGLDKAVELTTAEYSELSQAEKMNGTTYFITDADGAGSYSVVSETLSSGSTTVTFAVPTSGDHLLDVYTSDGRNYTAVDTTTTSGAVTFTFEAPSSNVTVYLEIKEI